MYAGFLLYGFNVTLKLCQRNLWFVGLWRGMGTISYRNSPCILAVIYKFLDSYNYHIIFKYLISHLMLAWKSIYFECVILYLVLEHIFSVAIIKLLDFYYFFIVQTKLSCKLNHDCSFCLEKKIIIIVKNIYMYSQNIV